MNSSRLMVDPEQLGGEGLACAEVQGEAFADGKPVAQRPRAVDGARTTRDQPTRWTSDAVMPVQVRRIE
jgi:hypothetical protein